MDFGLDHNFFEGLITINVYVFFVSLESELSRQSFRVSLDELVSLLPEIGLYLFYLLVDHWRNYDSLSQWFHKVFLNHLRLSDDSFSHHLRFGRHSLGINFRFLLDYFLLQILSVDLNVIKTQVFGLVEPHFDSSSDRYH